MLKRLLLATVLTTGIATGAPDGIFQVLVLRRSILLAWKWHSNVALIVKACARLANEVVSTTMVIALNKSRMCLSPISWHRICH